MEMVNNSTQKTDLLTSLLGGTNMKNTGADENKTSEFEMLFRSLINNPKNEDALSILEGVETSADEWEVLLEGLIREMETKNTPATSEEKGKWLTFMQSLLNGDQTEMTGNAEGVKINEEVNTLPLGSDNTAYQTLHEIATELAKEWTKKIEELESKKAEITMHGELSGVNEQKVEFIRDSLKTDELVKGKIALQNANEQSKRPTDEGKEMNLIENLESDTTEKIKSSDVLHATANNKSTENRMNPIQGHRNAILSDVTKGILNQPSTTFKVINPEKIVIQLKPMELGQVEVTIENINGKIQIQMKSDNPDVQELLDTMMDEIKEEVKMKASNGAEEQAADKQQDEKTKEERVITKKQQYEEEKTENSSFDEILENMLGGYGNA